MPDLFRVEVFPLFRASLAPEGRVSLFWRGVFPIFETFAPASRDLPTVFGKIIGLSRFRFQLKLSFYLTLVLKPVLKLLHLKWPQLPLLSLFTALPPAA